MNLECGPSGFSITINFDDRFGKGLWRFLRQVVSNATLDDLMGVLAREFFGIETAVVLH